MRTKRKLVLSRWLHDAKGTLVRLTADQDFVAGAVPVHADGPQIVVRDFMLGGELAKSTKDRADYLELHAKAQQTVPEAALVDTVREVLGPRQKRRKIFAKLF